jgi:Zn-finger nucleic acid-binding protein
MPIETICPSCQRSLRVSDELVGHSVRCPECGGEWIAAAALPLTDSIARPEAAPSNIASPSPENFRETIAAPIQKHDDHIREQPAAPDSSSPAPPPPSAEDHDENDDEEFERDLEDRHHRRFGRESADRTKKSLLGPSIGILSASGLTLLSALLHLVGAAFGIYAMTAAPGALGPSVAGPAIYLILFVVYVIKGAVMLYGGLQLLKARRFGWSMAACIAAIVPTLDCCFLVGLPFGIWGLVVLLQPNVKQAFQYRAPADNKSLDDPLED